jgi:hypothetical protein
MALKAGAEKLLDVLMNQAAKSLQAAIRPNLAKTGKPSRGREKGHRK